MSQTPGRILVTADLHFSLYRTGDACVRELASRVCESDADVFVIAGDIADTDLGMFDQCLRLFDGFEGRKLLVPGNHDLWTDAGSSSDRYHTLLPQAAQRCGFHMLDTGPVVLGDVGFIGSIGWYDYSMRSPHLEATTQQYRDKSMPGLCSWNDRTYVKWDLEDEEFVQICLDQLQRDYREVESGVRHVVAVLHHLPFTDLLYGRVPPALEFCKAYMGSVRFGELLTSMPKVDYVFCGHRHGVGVCRRGGLTALVAGGEYTLKRLLDLDLATGEYTYEEFAATSMERSEK